MPEICVARKSVELILLRSNIYFQYDHSSFLSVVGWSVLPSRIRQKKTSRRRCVFYEIAAIVLEQLKINEID